MKYKSGLILGKFYPFHLGHKHLIDVAISNCEKVSVIVCHNSSQFIPVGDRVSHIRETFKKRKNLHIFTIDDENFPKYDSECETLDEFYSYWVPAVKNLVKDLDVVYTSEDYGDDFARYLGISHYLVDKQRIKYPVSGSSIRENPFIKWDFIPEVSRPSFVKKIAILGPESVGKTVLTEKISNRFHTNFVPEYGRLVYESKNRVDLDDFMKISVGRQSLEDWMVKFSNKIIFLDTEDIVTYIFSKLYYPKEYRKYEDYFLEKIKKHRYDLYILLRPDCDVVQDGTRNFLSNRWNHFKLLKDFMVSFNIDFVEVSGNWDERYKKSISIIQEKFNI